MRKQTWLLIATGVAMTLLIASCARKATDNPSAAAPPAGAAANAAERGVKAIPVTVTRVVPRDLAARVPVTGTLKAANEVTVGTRIAGRVVWVIGKEGTPVKRGMVVVKMDDADARSQVLSADAAVDAAGSRVNQAKAAYEQQKLATDAGIRSAQAGLRAARARLEVAKAAVAQQLTSTGTGINIADAGIAAAEARYKQAQVTADATEATMIAQVKSAEATLDAAKSHLAEVKNGARTQERAVAESAVRQAKVSYENDKTNYERYQNLYADKAIARSLLDNANAKMQVSLEQYKSAQEQLSMIKEGARVEDIQAAEAGVRQANEGLSGARANLKQIDVARANVEIARTALEQAKASAEAARGSKHIDVMRDKDVLTAIAGVQQADQALQEAYAGRKLDLVRKNDIYTAQSALEQAHQAKAMALQNQDYTQIYSPVDGVVSHQLVDLGTSLGAGKDVMGISSTHSLDFEANVSELDATRMRSGQSVELAVDAMQGSRENLFGDRQAASIIGTVQKVVPVVDAKTRNFLVRIIVPANPALYPGMFARGQIITERYPHALAVPKSALVDRDGKQVIYLAEDGVARERTVTAGIIDGNYVQILSGIVSGTQVITVGQQTLLDGDKIAVNNDQPKPSATPKADAAKNNSDNERNDNASN